MIKSKKLYDETVNFLRMLMIMFIIYITLFFFLKETIVLCLSIIMLISVISVCIGHKIRPIDLFKTNK